MKKIIFSSIALVLLLTLIAFMAGWFNNRIEPGLQPLAQTFSPADAVAVEQIDIAMVEPVPATIRAKQATIISSRILARIVDIKVRAGDTVSKGELLVQLEQTDLQSRAARAKEQINAIKARLKEAVLQLNRIRELRQRNLVAVAELDKARANHDALSSELAAAKQALAEAKTAVEYSEIRAPINGKVVDRFAEPGDTASPGVKLLSLYNPLSLRVEAQVRESLALSLQLGQSVNVDIPAIKRRVPATIDELVPAADPGSRSFLVKAGIEYDEVLLPGMYARLLVPSGSETRMIIPLERVVGIGQLNLVWVLENGRAEKRYVKLGKLITALNSVVVKSGLTTCDKVLPIQHSRSVKKSN